MDTNRKHAWLIMAFHKFDQLQILLDLLDDPRNDIYLHVDKRNRSFDASGIRLKHAGLFLLDRMATHWGADDTVICELNLLQAAGRHHYAYYHLLSGVDLPIKTQEEIHEFFRVHAGEEFIDFQEDCDVEAEFGPRIRHYFYLFAYTGRDYNLWTNFLRSLENISIWFQDRLHIRREWYFPLAKGANWFSITDALVQYVLSVRELAEKQYTRSYCADELLIQGLALKSPCREHIVNDCLRCIDWNRGSPYVFREEDYDALMASPKLIARKFDIQTDRRIIEKIADHLKP